MVSKRFKSHTKGMSNEIHRSITVKGIRLKKKQSEAYSLFQEGQSVFLTGPGGVGKTALLRMFAHDCVHKGKRLAVTSTTGTSALLLSGTTLHSFLGIGLGETPVKYLIEHIRSHRWLYNRWTRLDCLIIDEISMMHPNLFDKLEEVARAVRGREEPFGGIQLILSGDFLQLPCVKTTKFCFQAKTWEKCVSHVVYLDEIIRQGDEVFRSCLNEVRIGNITAAVRETLGARVGARLSNSFGIKPTKLYSKNVDVDRENDAELDGIAAKGVSFFAYEMETTVFGKARARRAAILTKFKKHCPAQDDLELCVGAQVMLIKNIDLTAGLANGCRGIITGFTAEPEMPKVKFLNGEERVIYPETWELEENGSKILQARQLPLRVAYALSIHKAQGSSLDYAEIDLSNIFEYGQAYVALSRVKSLTGLSIITIDYNCIQADPDAVEYYQSLK